MRKKIKQAKNKSIQAQVTQAVLAQENATIESILFFTQRMQRKRLHCVRLNGNRTLLAHSSQSFGFQRVHSTGEGRMDTEHAIYTLFLTGVKLS